MPATQSYVHRHAFVMAGEQDHYGAKYIDAVHQIVKGEDMLGRKTRNQNPGGTRYTG